MSLEHNFRELSRQKPPFLAKTKLRARLWWKYLGMQLHAGKSVFSLFGRRFAVSFVAILAASSVGFTSIYAYNSDEVTAYNFLYPVKQTLEAWVLAVAQTPTEKAQIHLDLSQKRTREVKKIIENNKKIDPATVIAIKSNNEQAVVAAEQITNADEKKIITEQIANTSEEQIDTLKEVKAEGIKIAAEQKDIPLEELSKPEISLGSSDASNSMDVTQSVPSSTHIDLSNDVSIKSITTSETIVADTPELQVVDNVLNETKKLNDNKENPKELQNSQTATGAIVLDSPLESVSLSTNSP